MPMRRTIGISLACLVTSACAIDKTPDESTLHVPDAAAQEPRSAGGGSERVEPQFASGQFGKAAWYDFVGRQTASGEILDTVTATAAHRSLPLDSFAKVTNLDNGRWVILKINDRGPYTRGRIIDLSPRSAELLDMKRAGVAAVVIEPLVNQAAAPTLAFQNLGTAVAQ
jgi:rare lipoprotein A